MTRTEATAALREACNGVALTVMKMHPAARALDDEATKGEVVRALFEITKHVEVVKKQLMRLEARDDNALV